MSARFLLIQEWMITDLKLSGNDRDIYAIIYGFSQDGHTWFTGTRKYLAFWAGCNVDTVTAVIKRLIDKGLIIRETDVHNGVSYNKYKANLDTLRQTGPRPVEQAPPPDQQVPPTCSTGYINNINKNLNNNTKDSANAQPSRAKLFNIPKNESCVKISAKADKWVKGKEKIILEYDFSMDLKESLWEFLTSLAQINALISDITFRAQLDKLSDKIKDENIRITVVKSTISRGWKSLDYAIDDVLKYKTATFDTSKPGSFTPKDPNNDDRWKQYEGQQKF